MNINHPGYLLSKYECFLLSRCQDCIDFKYPSEHKVKTTFAHICKICIYAKFAYMQIMSMCTELKGLYTVHGAICIRVQILHIYVRKSLHVYAFTYVCKICTYANVRQFAPASDKVQISCCVYANFAYMQIWSCKRKAKFAHVSIY